MPHLQHQRTLKEALKGRCFCKAHLLCEWGRHFIPNLGQITWKDSCMGTPVAATYRVRNKFRARACLGDRSGTSSARRWSLAILELMIKWRVTGSSYIICYISEGTELPKELNLSVPGALLVRMKFSSYLKAVEADAPPEWKHKFLNYRLLKKNIKGLRCVWKGGTRCGSSTCI